MNWFADTVEIAVALVLVLVNGFFVAAEFALVKVRGSQVDALVKQNRPFASTAHWLANRLDASLSACQLGITMASLGLGWVGEPAFASLLTPAFKSLGITSEAALHATAFVVAFSAITALHLVIGEQAPKIFAIRRPESMVLWCAFPLKLFYILTYPLLVALSASTTWILRLVGLRGGSEHESPHTEDEIRGLVHQAHAHGKLTRSEHQLIHGVFEFDDLICRRVMVPRNDVVYFDVRQPISACIELARRTKHTRYPVCDGSLDNVLGIAHIKDLVGVTEMDAVDLRTMMRPPKRVPETIPVSRLLRHFQATHQLMAVVVDEYGTVVGIATLENVLEPIIGSVEDEFDVEQPGIVPEGVDQFIVSGSASIESVARALQCEILAADVDTFSGLLTQKLGRIPEAGDQIDLGDMKVEVLSVRGSRAERTRVTVG